MMLLLQHNSDCQTQCLSIFFYQNHLDNHSFPFIPLFLGFILPLRLPTNKQFTVLAFILQLNFYFYPLVLSRNFSPRGALEIAHSPNISIHDSNFTNCRSRGSGKRQFSGNAGGLAIGYSPLVSEFDDLQRPTISITDSAFINNTAEADPQYFYNVIVVLRDLVYNQRGGGIAFFLGGSNYSSEIQITGCVLDGNHAQDSGGGIYMFLGGESSTHSVLISGTTFTANEAMDGGGLEITHSNKYSQTIPNNIVVVNSNFVRNIGSFGGGYKNIQLDSQTNLNNLLVKNCTFDSNIATVGAALYLQSVETVEVVPLLKRILIDDR